MERLFELEKILQSQNELIQQNHEKQESAKKEAPSSIPEVNFEMNAFNLKKLVQKPEIMAEPGSSGKSPFEMAVETNQSLSRISDSIPESFSDQTKTTIPVRERHRV